MVWRVWLGCLVLIFSLTGCTSEGTGNLQWEQLVASDQQFFKALQHSIEDVNQKVIEVEEILQEMQGHDEYHEAEEMMSEANEEILYHWNIIHNEYKPVHPSLQEMKIQYENLLNQYREGITTELDGMETGNPEKLRQGYQTTKEAILELINFKQQVNQVVTGTKE